MNRQNYLGDTLRAWSSVGFASASGWNCSDQSSSSKSNLCTVQIEKVYF